MDIPKKLFYAKTHEWVKINEDQTAIVGLSDHAQESMGDVAFINLCDEGEAFAAGDVIGDVESIKAVSDIYCPVSGTVTKVNSELLDSPEIINSEPYEAWLIELENVSPSEELMNAEEYEKYIEEE